MEFRQIETFIKVAELKSFSKAAQQTFITQPTVSEHIRQLEQELNARLFLRTKKEALLTPAGKVFLKHAKKILDYRRQVILEMGQFSDTVEGELTIGASSVPGEYILPGFIGSFHKKYPNIQIELRISDSKEAMNWVLERQCEIGFIGFHPNLKLLEVHPFSSDVIAPVTRKGHPAARKDPLTLRDLRSIPLVLREPGSGTRNAVERVLGEKGLSWKSFNVALVMESASAIINALLSGPFYSFLSLRSIENSGLRDQLTVLNVRGLSPIERKFYMIRGKKDLLSPMAQHFMQHITENVEPTQSAS